LRSSEPQPPNETGYSQIELQTQLERQVDFETFFSEAPRLNPSRASIKGVVCGVRVEDIEEPTMREIRYLDKLVDELARGGRWKRSCGNRCSSRPTGPGMLDVWLGRLDRCQARTMRRPDRRTGA
jgi:hypothetical protein